MQFRNYSYEDFIRNAGDKRIIQFGASSAWHYFLKVFPDISEKVLDRTQFIVDNDLTKQGQKFEINDRKFLIKNVGALKEEIDYVILITASLVYQKNICEQLSELGLPENTECYSLPLMTYSSQEANNDCVDKYLEAKKNPVNVPKIHSFWFSGEEKPDLYKRCIESWHKYCPKFEIIEWNTDNYDVTKNQYMREAFEHQKWAFVSDFARLDVVYNYGGIYLDMDVELRASLERLLNVEGFFCRQEDGLIELGSGFGALPGDYVIKEMLDTYMDRKLILDDGKIDMTSLPEWLSVVMERNGFYRCHDSQIIGNRLVLSNDYIMCSTSEDAARMAKLGVHWHNGGWLDAKDRKVIRDSFEVKEELVKKYFRN